MGVGWGWGGGCLVRLRGGGGGGGWRSVVPEPHRGSHCVSGLRAMQGGQVGRRRTAQFQQRPDGHGCFACWGCRCSLGMPKDRLWEGGGALTLTLYVSLVRFLSCRHLHWPPPASCRPGSMLQCRTAHHAPPACFPCRFPCAQAWRWPTPASCCTGRTPRSCCPPSTTAPAPDPGSGAPAPTSPLPSHPRAGTTRVEGSGEEWGPPAPTSSLPSHLLLVGQLLLGNHSSIGRLLRPPEHPPAAVVLCCFPAQFVFDGSAPGCGLTAAAVLCFSPVRPDSCHFVSPPPPTPTTAARLGAFPCASPAEGGQPTACSCAAPRPVACSAAAIP